VRAPIFLRLGNRGRDQETPTPGSLRNVIIDNVVATRASLACSVTGIPGHPVENVSLENIEITYPGRGNDGLAILPIYRLKDVPEQEAKYPEFSMFGELPAWAFYVRHVSGLSMKNITAKAVAPDYRPAFVFDDVDGLKLNVLDIHEDDSDKQVIFRNVRNYNKGLSSEIIKIAE